MKNEFSIISKTKGMRLAVFVYPLLIAFILFAVFHAESIKKVPVGVVDQDHSVTSREIVRALNAGPDLDIAHDNHYPDLHTAKMALQKSAIYGIVFIPPNFEKDVLAGNSPELTTFYNNQYMTTGSAVYRSISTVITAYLTDKQIDKLMARGLPKKVAEQQINPIKLVLNPLYNSSLNFVYSLVNGLFPTIIQILLMMIITASMQANWENKSEYLAFCEHHKNVFFDIFLKKLAIYLPLFLIYFLIFDLVLISHFNFKIAGDFLPLAIGSALFIMATISICIMVSLMFSDKLRNYGIMGILSSPAFGFIGLTFPHMAMNGFSHIWSAFLPINWLIDIRLNQTLRGNDLNANLTSYFALLLMIVIPLIVSQLILSNKKHKSTIKEQIAHV